MLKKTGFPVESTPMPFLIGISGGFEMYIYAIMQYKTARLHKTRAFHGLCCILCNFKKVLIIFVFLCKMSELYRAVWYYIIKLGNKT